jgi:hypothetical protein
MALPGQPNTPTAQPGWGQQIKEFFVGSPGRTQQFPRFTAQQQQLVGNLNPVISNLLSSSSGQNAFNFAPISQKARTNFKTQTVPSLAERFTALGGQNSSAFQGALGQAGSGLEESLAALESKYGLAQQGNQQQLLLALLSLALQPQFESAYTPSQPGLIQGAAGALGGLGGLGGAYLLQRLGLL